MAETDAVVRERVLSTRELTPGVFLLTASRERGFRPGQVVSVTTEPAIPARVYSIASGTGDPGMDLLFDVVPGGVLTPRLALLRPGDSLYVSKPFGSFGDGEGESVWVATGTGVAPFRSIARSGLLRSKTLVHGSRRLSGLFFRDYFREVMAGGYAPCCSAEEEPGVYRGRVTAWLSSQPLPLEATYLLCGSSEMVVDARDTLVGRGIPYAKVGAEIYF
jgi:ferredoxin-NADP reductase